MRAPVATLLIACLAGAQAPSLLLENASVRAAIEAAKRNEPQTIADQIRLSEIEAPPFGEAARGEALRRDFEELGLQNVRIDEAGNVIGERPGQSPRPNLVFSAHLDTVFPKGTDVGVKREGNELKGPGIADDARGLAVLLGVVRALNEGKVTTPGTITFVGTTGEEGLGDLRGVKHLFARSLKGKIDKFVSVDGTGLTITHVAVGSYRYRVTFKGPGGHSFGAFGNANPIHGLGRAIASIADFEVPLRPKTTFNVGRIGGGTSVNSIPFEAWMEVDMRSSDSAALKALDAKFQQAVKAAVEAENRRWEGEGKIEATVELVGLRPAGSIPVSDPIVQTALAVSKALGFEARLREGSTDANVPINLGVPGITVGGGGRGRGVHSLHESFDSTDSWKGTVNAVLLAIALAR